MFSFSNNHGFRASLLRVSGLPEDRTLIIIALPDFLVLTLRSPLACCCTSLLSNSFWSAPLSSMILCNCSVTIFRCFSISFGSCFRANSWLWTLSSWRSRLISVVTSSLILSRFTVTSTSTSTSAFDGCFKTCSFSLSSLLASSGDSSSFPTGSSISGIGCGCWGTI